MVFAYIYLFILLIVPHNWLFPSLASFHIDYFLLPIWLIFLIITGAFKNFRINYQDKFLIIWVCWVIITMVVNGVIGVETEELINYIKYLLVYIFISYSIQSLHQLRSFIFFFVFLAVILSIEGIQHKLTGIGWAGQTLDWVDPSVLAAGGTGRTRWIGIFDGPGVFCVIYTIALPFLLNGINPNFGTMWRLFSFISIPLVFIAIYFNGSRGGFLTSLAIILIYIGQYGIYKRSKLILVPGLLLVIAIFIYVPSHLTTTKDPTHSAEHRVEMWIKSFEMIRYHPIFGIGRGHFVEFTYSLDAHSSPIEIMGETGFIGLFVWMGFIYMGIKRLYYFLNESENKKDKLIISGLLMALIGYIVSSLFVTLEYVTFYILLALCNVVGKNVKTDVLFTLKDLIRILCFEIAFIVIAKIFVMVYFEVF